MATSKAQVKAVRKYEAANHKKITVYFPRKYETLLADRLKGQSFNGYVMDLIKKDLGIKEGNE